MVYEFGNCHRALGIGKLFDEINNGSNKNLVKRANLTKNTERRWRGGKT
jgi:hypothetical protein